MVGASKFACDISMVKRAIPVYVPDDTSTKAIKRPDDILTISVIVKL
jgi:hypothetical protein